MRHVGVCSWSLRPAGPGDLVSALAECGVHAVQLALDPIRTGAWPEAETAARLRSAGIGVISGMMATAGEDYSTLDSIRRTGGLRPDGTWTANLAAAEANAALAKRLGVSLVTLHAGFLPHEGNDPERGVMMERLRRVAGVFAARGVDVALETGQESAETLLEVLADLDAVGARVGVNFDPANMILYGMGEPVEALRRLAPRVRQIHIKDADPAVDPGEWGTEVPAGTGNVNWPEFFRLLRSACPGVNLVIEREAGESRVADIRTARALIERFMVGSGR